jgi:hypothetical protein
MAIWVSGGDMVKDVDLTRKSDKNFRNIMERLNGRAVHSISRAKERYGVEMTEHDYFKLIEQIVSFEAEYLRPARNPGCYMYRVRFNGMPILAIYESKYAMICTFLSWEMT